MSCCGARCGGMIGRGLRDPRVVTVRSTWRRCAPSSTSSRLWVHIALHRCDEWESVGRAEV